MRIASFLFIPSSINLQVIKKNSIENTNNVLVDEIL
jgi:hypothetical protein